MRHSIIIWTIITTTTVTAFGQANPKTLEYYRRHDQIGPFFMRWYWHLKGEPTTVWTETLTLTNDQRFTHYSSTSCLPGSTYGTWTKENNKIILKADSTWGTAILGGPEKQYELIIVRNKLYYNKKDIEDKKWAMKRIH
jgi:hypothetical protein